MKLTSRILAAGLSMVFIVSSVVPSQAFMPRGGERVAVATPIVNVQLLQDYEGGNLNRYHRENRRIYVPRRHRNGGYYEGRRYRDYSDRGYRHRRNNGAAIIGGLAAGALLGGIIANENRPVYRERRVYRERVGNRHVNWCYNRYRSYRAYDNSFQPNNGSRRACYSPYS
ncbi:BA14K family protein [Pararhizobium sp.]|uniref:BA14K family protein n=1 Tax=Pararhizobium sp. TaxID=1977563 RepID=UPI002717ADA7|nr:BA14K family protein [Pararhizobium sp.]MDO9415714.1 BA14K family protein [Pararhizobium sp.]